MKRVRVTYEAESGRGQFDFAWDDEADDGDENSIDGIVCERVPDIVDYSWEYVEAVGRPRSGQTPVRQIGRVPFEKWALICRAAELCGQSITEFCTDTLVRRAKRVIRDRDG